MTLVANGHQAKDLNLRASPCGVRRAYIPVENLLHLMDLNPGPGLEAHQLGSTNL